MTTIVSGIESFYWNRSHNSNPFPDSKKNLGKNKNGKSEFEGELTLTSWVWEGPACIFPACEVIES